MCNHAGLSLLIGDDSIRAVRHECQFVGDCGGGLTADEATDQMLRWSAERKASSASIDLVLEGSPGWLQTKKWSVPPDRVR